MELETDLAKSNGVKCLYIQADMSSAEDCTALCDKALAEFGQVDILVNNAGIQHVSPLVDFPEDAWDRVMNINLKALYLTSKACIPGMVERGYGRVLNVASVHGKVASLNKA